MKILPHPKIKNILIFIFGCGNIFKWLSRSDGMADVTDSKSVGSNTVWVQVPPPALNSRKRDLKSKSPFFLLNNKSII